MKSLEEADANIHNDLGNLLRELQHSQEAESAYRQALRIKPDHADAQYNLAILLQELQRFQEAEAAFRQVLRLLPDDADVHNNLGILLQELQRPQEAEAAYRQALRVKPDHAEAQGNLGVLLQEGHRFAEAEAAYRQALTINPDYADAHYNLGVLLQEGHRSSEAEAAFRQVLRLMPERSEAHYNLGVVLKELHRSPEAEEAFRQALHIKPDYAYAHYNLGAILQELQRAPEAEAAYLQALRSKPDFAEAQWNLSLLYLSMGRFQEGWSLYEARYHPNRKERTTIPIHAPFPMWHGEDLAGKSLLVIPEQGFGDQIQFCRYLPLLRAKGVAQLTLACPLPLVELFKSLEGVDKILVQEPNNDYPRHDFWTFLLSLPHHLEPTLAMLPDSIPYLQPPAHRLEHWQRLLPNNGRFRVGLVWAGNPQLRLDHLRSPRLMNMLPIVELSQVDFIGLQMEEGRNDLLQVTMPANFYDMGPYINDFADTAAIMKHLDLVISSCTAPVHLAGAIGVPCWVILPFVADWRWLHHRTDSPWYPGALRLFRQTRPDDWSEVVKQVKENLVSMIEGKR